VEPSSDRSSIPSFRTAEIPKISLSEILLTSGPVITTVASFKGGVGKTTTAVHLAAYLSEKAPTLLIDGDPNRSATGWTKRGDLPFKVVDERQAARFARDFEHIVIDTKARPEEEDLRALADGCDLLVIPTTPDALSLDALMLTVDVLERLGADRYRILLTIIPPRPSRDGDEARAMLQRRSLPLFKTGIHRLVAYQKAALAGVPVYKVHDPRAKQAWEDYKQVGKELLR
jgi:chromosome partitioning protein